MHNLNSLLWNSSSAFRDTIALLKTKNQLEIKGIASLALPSFLKALYMAISPRPLLFINSQESLNSLHKFSNQLKRLETENEIVPTSQVSLLEGLGESEHHFAKISELLNIWLNAQNSFVIASAKSLIQPVMPIDKFKHNQIILQKKQSLNLTTLLAQLVSLGYKRVDTVLDIGCFALRGDILDIYSAGLAVRLNFFGDEIESLKPFEPWTQRSIRNQELEKVIISPLRPFIFDFAEKSNNLQKLVLELEETQAEFWRQDLNNGDWQRFIPWLEDDLCSILDYFPTDGLIVIEEPMALEAQLQRIYERLAQELEHKLTRKYLPNSQKLLLEKIIQIPQTIFAKLADKKVLKIISG